MLFTRIVAASALIITISCTSVSWQMDETVTIAAIAGSGAVSYFGPPGTAFSLLVMGFLAILQGFDLRYQSGDDNQEGIAGQMSDGLNVMYVSGHVIKVPQFKKSILLLSILITVNSILLYRSYNNASEASFKSENLRFA